MPAVRCAHVVIGLVVLVESRVQCPVQCPLQGWAEGLGSKTQYQNMTVSLARAMQSLLSRAMLAVQASACVQTHKHTHTHTLSLALVHARPRPTHCSNPPCPTWLPVPARGNSSVWHLVESFTSHTFPLTASPCNAHIRDSFNSLAAPSASATNAALVFSSEPRGALGWRRVSDFATTLRTPCRKPRLAQDLACPW
jgi:hypothetical protein